MKGYYQENGQWYPEYPDLGATVAKLRREAMKAGSVMAMPREARRAYAEAIFKAIRAKHRTLHMRPTPSLEPNWYSPPSVTRLLRHETPPIGMHGEPEWRRVHNAMDWQNRAEALYAQAMENKQRGA
jgi:RimJ/RimL family protein N-acetyltransferase